MTSSNTSALEATESFDVSKDASVDKLHAKAIGLIGVLFLTVTGAAPESAMLGNVPFAAGFGNGIYVPAAFLLATIVLTIFSVGFAAMASKVSSVGGFYSFISLGLGRDVGMAAGISSLACYSIFEASLTGLFAYFGNQWIQAHFGVNVPWLYLAFFVIALSSFLSYQDVQLSVKVLGAALVFEVIMLSIFDIGVLVAKGPGAFNLEALNVFHVMTPVVAQKVGTTDIAAGAAAVGVFMAFWSWVGFEMAPNYAEEFGRSKAHHSQVAILLRHRPWPFLHRHQLVCDFGLSDRRRHVG
ncbi:MAG: APC family permease [Hyphomicrobium sp.]|uniref:APC family permease n=1 Tax=Hyphomicrobium sp. TaxID=82 RepID=UPI0039E67A7C